MLRFAALWLLVRVFGRLPRRLLYAAADACGTLAWFASARLRAVTQDHVRHTSAGLRDARERDRAARACVGAAARYWADFARTSHVSREAALAEAEAFDGIDHLFAALDRGCGVIMLSAHVGNPEFLVRAAGYLQLDILVLTEQLKPQRLHELVHAVRSGSGVRFVPAGMSGGRAALTHLRRGGLVALMADRDIQHSGRLTPFFGERARLPTGPIELARRTHAAVVPGFASRTRDGGTRITFLPELELRRSDDREADLDAGMLAMARALEEGIGAAPDQWFVLQPIWSGIPR